jgi:hypothetical protein
MLDTTDLTLPSRLEFAMSLGANHDIRCVCGETLSLSESTLRRIVANLQEIDRAAPRINFVCSHCKAVFRFDYRNRKPMDVVGEVPSGPDPLICIVGTKCGEAYCGSTVELVIVAKSGTSPEEFQSDLHGRDWTKFSCENRHSLVSPGSVRQIC